MGSFNSCLAACFIQNYDVYLHMFYNENSLYEIISSNYKLVKYLKKSSYLISDQHFSFKVLFKISLKDQVVLSTTSTTIS